MKTLFRLALAMVLAVHLTTRVAADSPLEMVIGEAEIVKIEKRPWGLKTIGPNEQSVAEGKLVVTLRITLPEAYRDPARVLGVYDEKELKIDDHVLAVGDVISFQTMRIVFEDNIEPDVFSNLKNIAVVSKAQTAKAPVKKQKKPQS